MAKTTGQVIDDCWNRIGVWARAGRDCPRLAEQVHCRNCTVFRDAGQRFLDREISHPDSPDTLLLTDQEESSLYGDRGAGEAEGTDNILWLLFHLGRGWYALPARVVERITEPRPVHDLPHKRGRALLGLVNVAGRLHPCMDMGRVLDVPPSASPREDDGRHYRRLILLGDQGNRFAFHATGVTSLRRPEEAASVPLPETPENRQGAICGTCEWEGGILSLLDPDSLFLELTRGLR